MLSVTFMLENHVIELQKQINNNQKNPNDVLSKVIIVCWTTLIVNLAA